MILERGPDRGRKVESHQRPSLSAMAAMALATTEQLQQAECDKLKEGD